MHFQRIKYTFWNYAGVVRARAHNQPLQLEVAAIALRAEHGAADEAHTFIRRVILAANLDFRLLDFIRSE